MLLDKASVNENAEALLWFSQHHFIARGVGSFFLPSLLPCFPEERKNKHTDSTYSLWDRDPLNRELEINDSSFQTLWPTHRCQAGQFPIELSALTLFNLWEKKTVKIVLGIITCPHWCNTNQSLKAITWRIKQKTWSTSEHEGFSKKFKPFLFKISTLTETYTWDVQAYGIWLWAG